MAYQQLQVTSQSLQVTSHLLSTPNFISITPSYISSHPLQVTCLPEPFSVALGSDSWGAKVHPVKEQEWAAEGAITILPKQKTVKGKQARQTNGKFLLTSMLIVYVLRKFPCVRKRNIYLFCVLNLRSCHLRLTLCCAPLYS